MTTTVEAMADAFKEAGTPFIVGHPGGESVELMDAARQRDMRFLLMKQETAGAILAATWGEITGSPGVCLSTRGPGATNMVNGAAYASLDRAPLIIITDRYGTAAHETGLRQRLDQKAVYAPLVKWGTTLDSRVIHQQLNRAVRVATAPAPGPVHFDFPHDQTGKEATPQKNPPSLLPNLLLPAPDSAALKPIAARISAARQPIIIAGLGVLWDRASSEVVQLAEKLGAPVLVTSKCKGLIPEDHVLRAGCVIGGLIERKLVMASDLIITVGLDGIELQPQPWPYNIPVISLANIQSLDGLVPSEVEVIGELKGLISGVTSLVSGGGNWGEKAAATFRTEVTNALNTPSAGLSPQRAMEVARACLPRDTIATCDAGASRLLIVQKWQSYGPREFLTSNCLGTMGYAVPGALAARLAHPDRPVVAFTGDGGFLMAVAELQTSVKEKLPIIVIILDDQEIGLIRVKQEIKQIPRFGISVGGCNWEKLAQGFGADGVVVDSENGLQDAIAAALKTGNTTVIGVRIDGSGYVDQFNALREL